MEKRPKRKFNADFKAKVVIEALKERTSRAESLGAGHAHWRFRPTYASVKYGEIFFFNVKSKKNDPAVDGCSVIPVTCNLDENRIFIEGNSGLWLPSGGIPRHTFPTPKDSA